MPTYEYGIVDADGALTGERFEHFAGMRDAPLTTCPATGRPCRRVPVVPQIIAGGSEIIDWQLGAPPGVAQDLAMAQTPSVREFTPHGAAIHRSARAADRAQDEFYQSHGVERQKAAEAAEKALERAARGD